MTNWVEGTLQKIAAADDLHISPLRQDGKTYGTPTWIWYVVVDDALYARAYNGQNSRWYQAAIRQQAGRVRAAGRTHEVVFESVDGPLNDRIDSAYRAKYKSSPYVGSMVGVRARSATVRIVPQENQSERKDDAMPHVIVKLVPGKSERQKQRLADAIARDVMEILHYGEEWVSVAMEEIGATEWATKVFGPDIQSKPDRLYKKPGYGLAEL